MPWVNFVERSVYSRRADIHAHFGGQQQGGICTPANHPVVIAFTGESGHQHGYSDGWTDAGTYRYFGEGQVGPMAFKAGNLAIRDHLTNGKDLLLFQTLGKGKGVRFLGQFECAGYALEDAPDRTGAMRQAIVFELVSFGAEHPSDEIEEIDAGAAVDLAQLRERAIQAAQSGPQVSGTMARRSLYKRAEAVRSYVLARSAGVCEGCNMVAPFRTALNEPYLEPHHIRRLSDGGPDDPRYMAALCPNCHREVHHGIRGQEKNQLLFDIVQAKEGTFPR